jgi:predicted nucleic-acid-binding Zn-ribbon protein
LILGDVGRRIFPQRDTFGNGKSILGSLTMDKKPFSCLKCDGTAYQAGEIRATGSGISRFLNIQNQKYATVACTSCNYTELYRLDGGRFGNIVDLFTN